MRMHGDAEYFATPAKAGAHARRNSLLSFSAWLPAFAGMTKVRIVERVPSVGWWVAAQVTKWAIHGRGRAHRFRSSIR